MPDRVAEVCVHGVPAGYLREHIESEGKKKYSFSYHPDYSGPPVSLTMPVRGEPYLFQGFPPFFDGLLPEGVQLESLLRRKKIDKNDYFSQLIVVGADMVGSVTVYASNGPSSHPGGDTEA
jgi:serine/threonine-protein kinase HipA